MNWWPLAMSAAIFLLVLPSGVHSRRAHRAQSFKISPKPCRVDGERGTCMFVWECVKGGGRHLGMCVDDFMFGTCCTNSSSPSSSTERTHPIHFPGQDTAAVVSGIVHSGYRPPPRPTGAPHLVSSGIRPPSPPFAHFVTSASFSTPFYHSPTSLSQHSGWSHRPTSPWPIRTTPRPYNASNRRPTTTTSTSTTTTARPTTAVTTTTTQKPTTTTTTTTTTTKRPPTTTTRRPTTRRPQPTTRKPATTRRPQAPTRRPSATTRRPTTRRPPNTTTRRWSTTTQRPTEKTTQRTTTRPMTAAASTHASSSSPPHFITRPRPPASPPLWANRPRPSLSTTTTKKTPTSHVTKRPPNAATKKPVIASAAPPTTSKPTTTSKPVSSTTPKSTTTPPVTLSLVGTGSTWKDCGVTPFHPRPETRIVGGKNAAFGGWPWQVSVRRTSFFGFSSTHRCGGAILNENWIATAGHCVDDLLTSQIRIRVGEHDFSKTGSESGDALQQLQNGADITEPLSHVERGVARKVVHPRYNFFTYEYDLALVRLSEPLPPPSAAPHVAPICLPGSDDLLVGENATVTGWGRLSEGGTLPSVLQQVTVPIVSNEKCKSMFLRAGRHEFIPDIFLCAGYEEGGRDSCQGDSGGPLQVRGKDGRYFLAGIISWGIGCAEANLPGVCTRISKFVDWIQENVT